MPLVYPPRHGEARPRRWVLRAVEPLGATAVALHLPDGETPRTTAVAGVAALALVR